MKMFAVILASIAAIAASTQAYLIWRDSGRATSRIEIEKIPQCKALISSLSAIKRNITDVDGQVERNIAALNRNLNLYSSPSENESEFTEIETRRTAESMVLGISFAEMEQLIAFVDVGSLFFTSAETDAIGLSAISEGAEAIDRSSYYSPARSFDFDVAVTKLQTATEQLPGVMDVCEPILLSD